MEDGKSPDELLQELVGLDVATVKNAAAMTETLTMYTDLLNKLGERVSRLENRVTSLEQLYQNQNRIMATHLQAKFAGGTTQEN